MPGSKLNALTEHVQTLLFIFETQTYGIGQTPSLLEHYYVNA